MDVKRLNIVYLENEMKAVAKKMGQIMFERQENSILHNSFEWSEQIYNLIKDGDKEGIKKFVLKYNEWVPGKLGNDSLRSLKNCCICFIANLTYRIIKDNLSNSERAYSLSDACIQLIEMAESEQDVTTVALSGVFEYIDILSCPEKKRYHHLTKSVKNYIFKNLHSKIQISHIAEQLDVNASYLSRVFHQSEGITIQQYILRERLQQAKNLLCYSEYSVEEISSYLGFASQSHLGKSFKNETGLTPIQYRQKYSELYRPHF